MSHHLRIIPYADVKADIEETRNKQASSSNPSTRSQNFNTAHHLPLEIQQVIPESCTFTHETPSWLPFCYTTWHPLVAESQGLAKEDFTSGQIPSFLWEDLMRLHAHWYFNGDLAEEEVDEVVDTWLLTKAGKDFAPFFDGDSNGKRKWFVRLDQMSPKDSPLGGKLPCTTMQEVIVRICSSMRAYGCLQREAEDAKEEGREMEIKLVVNKWDEGMDVEREFRVFVPPPLARLPDRQLDSVGMKDVRISAISQYRWTAPLHGAFKPTDTVERLVPGAQHVLHQIIEFAEECVDTEVQMMLVRYGFSFDVIIKEGGEVQLVEINPFGALSGCGACLFHWVRDGRVLYGLDGLDVEVAVTLEN
jgi:hypothetical protein